MSLRVHQAEGKNMREPKFHAQQSRGCRRRRRPRLRAGGDVPKQYRELADEPVIRPTLALFSIIRKLGAVQPVIHPGRRADISEATAELERLMAPVPGGATRQASVRAGLEALRGAAPELVLIHDAARPFLSGDLITRAIAAAKATAPPCRPLPLRIPSRRSTSGIW